MTHRSQERTEASQRGKQRPSSHQEPGEGGGKSTWETTSLLTWGEVMTPQRRWAQIRRFLIPGIAVGALILAGVLWYGSAGRGDPRHAQQSVNPAPPAAQDHPVPPQAPAARTPAAPVDEHLPAGYPCVDGTGGRARVCEFVIHPSLPPYVLRLRAVDGSEDEVVIEISRKGETKTLQVLEASVDEDVRHPSLRVVDVNFDGYLDIALQTSQGQRYDAERYWLFNPRTGLFVHAAELEDLCEVSIHPGRQELSSYCYGGDAGGTFTRDTFKWLNGKLFKIRAVSQEVRQNLQVEVEYWKLRRGQFQRVLHGPGDDSMRALGDPSALVFVTPTVGWLLGVGWRNGGDDLLHTEDGGETWSRQRSPGTSGLEDQLPLQIQFLDSRHGWVLYYGSRLHRTTDGGHAWEIIPVTLAGDDARSGAELGQFVMLTPEIGYGVDEDGGRFLRTADGGRSWQWAPTPKDQEWFHNIFFLDVNRGWLTGDGGSLYATTDGGKSWRALPTGRKGGAGWIHFVSPDVGWTFAGYPSTLFRTRDGGTSWQQCGDRPHGTGRPVFHSALLGWAPGDRGILWRTTDGCATWHAIQTPVAYTLSTVHFVDDHLGWAVGSNDTVLKTTDGGLTWAPVPVKAP